MARTTKLRAGAVIEDTIEDKDGDTKVTVEANSDEDKIRFETAGAERVTIMDDGDVGIGNVTPVAKLEVQEDDTNKTTLQITTDNDNSSAGPVFELKRNSSSPAAGDYIGQIKFQGENENDNNRTYVKVTGKITDASADSEDALLEVAVRKDGSNVITTQFTGDTLKLKNGCGLGVEGNSVLQGGVKLSKITDVFTSPFSVTDDHFVLRLAPQVSGIDIQLPSKNNRAGQVIIVKDALGQATSRSLRILPNGTDMIDGANIFIFGTNYQSVTLMCDGINGWMKIGQSI